MNATSYSGDQTVHLFELRQKHITISRLPVLALVPHGDVNA
jgi:hypothetical protein